MGLKVVNFESECLDVNNFAGHLLLFFEGEKRPPNKAFRKRFPITREGRLAQGTCGTPAAAAVRTQ